MALLSWTLAVVPSNVIHTDTTVSTLVVDTVISIGLTEVTFKTVFTVTVEPGDSGGNVTHSE